ncbi:hypothetical protein ACLOJK_024732 [Asimina triloba]
MEAYIVSSPISPSSLASPSNPMAKTPQNRPSNFQQIQNLRLPCSQTCTMEKPLPQSGVRNKTSIPQRLCPPCLKKNAQVKKVESPARFSEDGMLPFRMAFETTTTILVNES